MKIKENRKVVWMGSSLEDLKKFPETVKGEVGFALHRAQEGKKHHKAKPLKGFSGVFEIVSDFKSDTYRAVYGVKIGRKIYILHAFKKKSKTGIKTPKPDLEIIRKRFKDAHMLAQEE
jgi:phage-related protein